MNIVIPMAGLGTRFSECGFTLPKPLIPVAGKPMYRHAVDCLPLHLANKLVFILLKSDFSDALYTDIAKTYQDKMDCTILVLEEKTQGQAETVLKASPYLRLDQPTLIHNCDTYFTESFNWPSLLQQEIDGAVVVFSSQESRWSYVQLDERNMVIAMQEKRVISSHASTGTYFFNDTPALISRLEHVIQSNLRENNEYYLSTVYQLMLQAKKTIIGLATKTMLCFGTPQDLVHSLNFLVTHKATL